jgi:hypothetical protein
MKKILFTTLYAAFSMAASAQVCVSVTLAEKTATTAKFNFTLMSNGSSAVTDYTFYLLPTTGSSGATRITFASTSNAITLPYLMGSSTVNLANGASNVAFELTTYLGDASGVLNNGATLSYSLCAPSIALPVELVDFKGIPQYKGNLLTWTTASEVNNKGFNVERLMANGEWETLGFVNAQGKAAAYEFVDNQPFTIAYYRLRQMDNDGKETLSKVISIAREHTHDRAYLRVYPSVTTGELTIETALTGDFVIYNLLGREFIKGENPQQVDVSTLPTGTYIVKMGDAIAKFVKQ